MLPPGAAPELPDPDFWNERPARAATHSRPRRLARLRTVAAVALVGVLAAALGLTTRHAGRRVALGHAQRPETSTTTSGPGAPSARALLRLLPAGAVCRNDNASVDTATCTLARVSVEYRLVPVGELRSAYLRDVLPGFAGGSPDLAAGAGAPACARGAVDERAWSVPAAPRRAVGRYACRIEQGRAAMWWTLDDRGLLAHATADTDLTSLFAWWESHSER